MIRAFRILLLITLLGILMACGPDDSDTIARREIRDVLYDVTMQFNLHDVYQIMEHLHDEYLHKGMIAYHFNDLWLDRMAQFNLLEIEVLYIEIQGDLAIAHTKNTFSSSFETVVLNEPEDSGDISYFKRENGAWQIYGNQLWSKAPNSLSRKGNLLVCR